MGDWIGLIFFVLLIAGIFIGLKLLAKPQKRTAEDFERNIAEGGSGLSAGVNALQEILDPAEARAKEVKVQLKEVATIKRSAKEKRTTRRKLKISTKELSFEASKLNKEVAKLNKDVSKLSKFRILFNFPVSKLNNVASKLNNAV